MGQSDKEQLYMEHCSPAVSVYGLVGLWCLLRKAVKVDNVSTARLRVAVKESCSFLLITRCDSAGEKSTRCSRCFLMIVNNCINPSEDVTCLNQLFILTRQEVPEL